MTAWVGNNEVWGGCWGRDGVVRCGRASRRQDIGEPILGKDRTVTQNTPALGKLVEGDQRRDAIHVAVAPVVAARRLCPGQHVGLLEDGRASDTADTLI